MDDIEQIIAAITDAEVEQRLRECLAECGQFFFGGGGSPLGGGSLSGGRDLLGGGVLGGTAFDIRGPRPIGAAASASDSPEKPDEDRPDPTVADQG